MFELKISDLNEASKLSRNWATHTISLLDPGIDRCDFLEIKLPEANKNGLLQRYFFHDITSQHDSSFMIFLTEKKEAILANPQHIQDILEFTALLQSTDKLLVHCHAGVSRSTAVACGVLCQHGLTPIEAVKHVVSIRPQAFPNRLILRLFDEILGLKGDLIVAGTEEIFSL
ncbi:hypothetical protein [Candidatus Parabeggiatoa sp. HSG14]|uniref:hypothetical protein n=1 Tax=Candidatus Parabeggiatoa sp. HSG14 TaxID=3055593 RepID=UPI0025A72589|nr:hypothetical protein [Thiotrichales bacterium HSG14]